MTLDTPVPQSWASVNTDEKDGLARRFTGMTLVVVALLNRK